MPHKVKAVRKKTSRMFYYYSYLQKHRNPSFQDCNFSYQPVQGKGTVGARVHMYLGGGNLVMVPWQMYKIVFMFETN